MREGWRNYKLGDLIDIKHGYAFKGDFFSDQPTADILLTPGNFKIGGGFKSDKFKYYKGEYPEDYILKACDIIVTMTDLSKEGDTLGYSAIVPDDASNRFLHNQRIGLIQFKNEDCDKLFLYWLLRTKTYQTFIVSSATGTTVKHTSPTRIQEYEFQAPDLHSQRRIAGILSALDEKIELNRQTNQTLEAIAHALFKEWFVDFNFPRATGETKDSEMGTIPVGWTTGKLGDVCDLNPKLPLKKGAVTQYVEMKDLSEDSAAIKKSIEREFSSGSKFQNGDTLLARITPCLENGKTGLVNILNDGEVGWGSTEFIVLRGKDFVSPYYVYCLARQQSFRDFAIQSMVGSSGRQRVVESILSDFDILVPDEKVMNCYHTVVSQAFQQLHENEQQNATLSATLDILLPKLMSGEIVV